MAELQDWTPRIPQHARLDDGVWIILAICPDCGDEQIFKSRAKIHRRFAEPNRYSCLSCHVDRDVRNLRNPETGETYDWSEIVPMGLRVIRRKDGERE